MRQVIIRSLSRIEKQRKQQVAMFDIEIQGMAMTVRCRICRKTLKIESNMPPRIITRAVSEFKERHYCCTDANESRRGMNNDDRKE